MSEPAVVKVNKALATPTVHLNGTSAEELKDQFHRACAALQGAYTVLAGIAPHGRDYYVQTPDGYTQAREEHHARLAKITEIQAELVALYDAVTDQQRSQR